VDQPFDLYYNNASPLQRDTITFRFKIMMIGFFS